MYLQHFGLKEFPFGITPDTSFFFSSVQSQQALNTLLVATRAGEGFIKITGEVGTGKTLLCRQLLNSLGPEFQTAFIPNPNISPMGLLLELANELGADTKGLERAPKAHYPHLLQKALNDQLLLLAEQGQQVLVCLDEVQAMPVNTLEALRLLTNLETEKRKLIQVVIFGQPELDTKLSHPAIRQLRQRITFEQNLGPLSAAELASYLQHRMRVAGREGPAVFSAAALRVMAWRTRGFPRLVNIVAHKALMCAYGRGKEKVGLMELHDALADTVPVRLRVPQWAAASGALMALGLLLLQLTRNP